MVARVRTSSAARETPLWDNDPVSRYDIIGDIHGHASKLREILEHLGYAENEETKVFGHADRQAIFVGDLIDRGPEQLEVLEIVKGMVDAGSAQIVLGNHEFNAIAYSLPDPTGPSRFLRPHTRKNRKQHKAFLKQLTRAQRKKYLEWFRTLPLWLDLREVRVVHACWHQPSIDLVEERLGGSRFTSVEQIVEAASKPHEGCENLLYSAVERLLKGPEVNLTSYGLPEFIDKGGHSRTHARAKWWKRDVRSVGDAVEIPREATDGAGLNYREAHSEELAQPVRSIDTSFTYLDSVPVIYGHYWREDEPEHLEDWTSTTACVDFSAGKGGQLVAYQWSDGEHEIDPTKYCPNGPEVVSASPSV